MTLFSKEHESFRERVRSFVDSRLAPHADEWERNCGFPTEVFREFGDEGLLGLTQARDCGGKGLDFGYAVVLAEELPRSKMMGLTLSIMAQAHIYSPLVGALGTMTQKEQFLTPAIKGEKIGALACTEPWGGSDIIRATHCEALDDGDSWVINGEKKFITNGPIADFVVVLARTKSEVNISSLSLILLPTTTKGFRIKERLRKLGLHTSPTGWLEFESCRIPKYLTLGKVNLGYFYVARSILEERLLAGVIAVSICQMILAETARYAQDRTVFGRPLSQLQAIRHRFAELATEVEMTRRFVYSVCESYRDGKVEEREICMIKLQAASVVQRVVEQCLQWQGGYGFLEDNWMTRIFRDARMLSVGGGPSELMKDLVASYLRL